MLDTTRAIETPEGVHLELRVAGPVVRGLAWGLDLFIRSIVYLALVSLLADFGRFGMGLFLLLLFLLEWFYPVAFEVRSDGATPGKRALGIKVVHDNGLPVGWSSSIVRNLLRMVDFLPVAYGLGLGTMLFSRDFKRLGDLAAGTVVVYREGRAKAAALPQAEPVPPPFRLTLTEQRAVLAFAERAPALTPERAEELAEILRPLTGLAGNAGMRRLYQIAAWLEGRREAPRS